MNIGFIGLGKLGFPCAEVIARKNHSVTGFDINHIDPTQLIKICASIEETVKDRDIVFIAVPTPHDILYDGRIPSSQLEPKDFSYDIVKECLIEANKFMNKNQLLVLISTVLPGTIRKHLLNLVSNTKLVYNPYLIAMGTVAYDMVNPEMIMIGTNDGTITNDTKKLIEFYETIMENDPRYEVGTYDECECIKVFYNTFISAKISLVNMIQDVAMRQGNINVDVVTDALAKSTMRIMGPQYMKAGMGDGGSCHPRDNIALRYLAKELNLGYDLFDSIMTSREIQAKNLADFLIHQNDLYFDKDNPIYIFGKSYKPDVSYCDGSYSILISYYIEQQGYTVKFVDPLTNDIVNDVVNGIILLAHNSKVTYKYQRNKKISNNLYAEISNNSIVVDPWRTYNNENVKVIHYGNSRHK